MTADTIAAVLTVLGYSMYDTVIVFDRVRENIPILRRMTASKVVNQSLAETITRSLNTSFVTLIPVVLLFIFGAGAFKDFAFALIVGIASGAYSSIFVAAPVLAMLMERQPAFVRRRQEIAQVGTGRARDSCRRPWQRPRLRAPRRRPAGSRRRHRRRPVDAVERTVATARQTGLPSGKPQAGAPAAPIQVRHATGPRFLRSSLL